MWSKAIFATAVGVVAAMGVEGRGQDVLEMPRWTLAQGPNVMMATVAEGAGREAGAATRPRGEVDRPEVAYLPPVRLGLERWIDNPALPPSTAVKEEVEWIRSASMGRRGFLDQLGNFIDVGEEEERPWSRTMSMRLQARPGRPTGAIVPFISLAREEGALQDRERLGIGGGMAYYVAPDVSVATELLYFGDRGNSNNAWERETRWSVRLQWEF